MRHQAFGSGTGHLRGWWPVLRAFRAAGKTVPILSGNLASTRAGICCSGRALAGKGQESPSAAPSANLLVAL